MIFAFGQNEGGWHRTGIVLQKPPGLPSSPPRPFGHLVLPGQTPPCSPGLGQQQRGPDSEVKLPLLCMCSLASGVGWISTPLNAPSQVPGAVFTCRWGLGLSRLCLVQASAGKACTKLACFVCNISLG